MHSFNTEGFSLLFLQKAAHTISPPPPLHPTPLFILSRCAAEVRFGFSKAGNTQESGIQSDGTESPGVDFRRSLGEFEGKQPETKLQRWECTQGQSATGHSPVVRHNKTPPTAHRPCFYSSSKSPCYPKCTCEGLICPFVKNRTINSYNVFAVNKMIKLTHRLSWWRYNCSRKTQSRRNTGKTVNLYIFLSICLLVCYITQ